MPARNKSAPLSRPLPPFGKYYSANNDLPGARPSTASTTDPAKTRFHRPQHLKVVRETIPPTDADLSGLSSTGQVNVLKSTGCGIGGDRLNYEPQDEWNCQRSTEERFGWSEYITETPTLVERAIGYKRPTGFPSWIKHEKQVLRFYTYFVEDVVAQRLENERLRKCYLLYFLEDESMQVIEPQLTNSGIPQGTLVRRHRIPYKPLPEEDVAPDQLPRPPPRLTDKPHINYWDLNLRKDIMIYGRRHRIVDCDPFTKSFLTQQGVDVPLPEPEPTDLFTEHRNKVESVQPLRPYKRPATGRQFQPGDPKVLRFFGKWVDTKASKEGSVEPIETRHLVIHFHLEDETIEVAEDHDMNSGRYKAPLFLKRCKIPKDVKSLVTLPGMHTSHTLLNVVRSRGPGRIRDAVVIDNLETKPDSIISKGLVGQVEDERNYYHAEDFEIGQTVEIAGRPILIHDCDGFTKKYFKANFDIVMERLRLKEEVIKDRSKEIPPYTGFGSEEDSLTSSQGLEPRPPQADFFKFMHKDRQGFDGHILRFSARLLIDEKPDHERKFVIAYFLSDDTILVTQEKEQNSGRNINLGTRFMSRTKIKKPKEEQNPDPRLHSLYYTLNDLYVGAIVNLNSHHFLITAADEYVFSYMERESEKEKFPQSNVRTILEKVAKLVQEVSSPKQLMAKYIYEDPDDSGFVNERVFRQILHQFVGYNLSEHQLISLIRRYRAEDLASPSLPPAVLFSVLQGELKRINFLNFEAVLKAFEDKEEILVKEGAKKEKNGMLNKEITRRTLVSILGSAKSQLRIHNVNHLIDALVKSFKADEIEYAPMVTNLNWFRHPAKPVPPQVVKSNFDDAERNRNYVPVNYRDFVHKLENIIEPTKKTYIATDVEFHDDKNRFDQYKEDMGSKTGTNMVQKRNQEIFESSRENEEDDAKNLIDDKKPYKLNTENFF